MSITAQIKQFLMKKKATCKHQEKNISRWEGGL